MKSALNKSIMRQGRKTIKSTYSSWAVTKQPYSTVAYTVNRHTFIALHIDRIALFDTRGRHDNLDLVGGGATHDHTVREDSTHLSRLQITHEDCDTVLHLMVGERRYECPWVTCFSASCARTYSRYFHHELENLVKYFRESHNVHNQSYTCSMGTWLTSPLTIVRGASSPRSTSSTYRESASGWRFTATILPIRMSRRDTSSGRFAASPPWGCFFAAAFSTKTFHLFWLCACMLISYHMHCTRNLIKSPYVPHVNAHQENGKEYSPFFGAFSFGFGDSEAVAGSARSLGVEPLTSTAGCDTLIAFLSGNETCATKKRNRVFI